MGPDERTEDIWLESFFMMTFANSWTCYLHGTPTKRQVSKRQVSKRLFSKRPVSKRQVYKTSGLQNITFQNVWVQNVQFLYFLYTYQTKSIGIAKFAFLYLK